MIDYEAEVKAEFDKAISVQVSPMWIWLYDHDREIFKTYCTKDLNHWPYAVNECMERYPAVADVFL